MFLQLLLFFLILIDACLEGRDFVLFTQPKTGTHLMTPLLSELTGKSPYCPRKYMKEGSIGQSHNPNTMVIEEGCHCLNEIAHEIWEINKNQGSFLHFHTPYTIEMENHLLKNETIVFFVKRDPRDQIVSLLNHYKKFHFIEEAIERIPSDDERLLYMIQNHMRRLVLIYKGWLTSSICVVIEFGKLIGDDGEAVDEKGVIGEMTKISQALHLSISEDRLIEVYHRHFGHGNAFLKRKVGSWRDHFSERHKNAVKEHLGDLLIELGYEKDLNW